MAETKESSFNGKGSSKFMAIFFHSGQVAYCCIKSEAGNLFLAKISKTDIGVAASWFSAVNFLQYYYFYYSIVIFHLYSIKLDV